MRKPQKSEAELRAMILERIREHPVCPATMDVSVRAAHLSWIVDCMPPNGQHIAYADCCNLITKIAAELRLEYRLAPN